MHKLNNGTYAFSAVLLLCQEVFSFRSNRLGVQRYRMAYFRARCANNKLFICFYRLFLRATAICHTDDVYRWLHQHVNNANKQTTYLYTIYYIYIDIAILLFIYYYAHSSSISENWIWKFPEHSFKLSFFGVVFVVFISTELNNGNCIRFFRNATIFFSRNEGRNRNLVCIVAKLLTQAGE